MNQPKREIIFRAKELHGAKMQYGWPYKTANGWTMRTENGDTVGVRPDTIEQFLGITDSEGTKVYEGDVIELQYAMRGRKFTLAVDHEGFVPLSAGEYDSVHLSDIEGYGYKWRVKK